MVDEVADVTSSRQHWSRRREEDGRTYSDGHCSLCHTPGRNRIPMEEEDAYMDHSSLTGNVAAPIVSRRLTVRWLASCRARRQRGRAPRALKFRAPAG